MLGEMEIHEIRVGDLARRAGVAIPTVYYNFRSLTDIIAEATVEVLNRFLVPYSRTSFADARRRRERRTKAGSRARPVISSSSAGHWTPMRTFTVSRRSSHIFDRSRRGRALRTVQARGGRRPD